MLLWHLRPIHLLKVALIVLSGFGTDRPTLPHATFRALPGVLAAAERSDMNRCRQKRCGQNAFFRRFRLSTRCQQKEQLMLLLLTAVNRESGLLQVALLILLQVHIVQQCLACHLTP
jgi:hypothetical protein